MLIWTVSFGIVAVLCFLTLRPSNSDTDQAIAEEQQLISDYTLKGVVVDGWESNLRRWSLKADTVTSEIGSSIQRLFGIYDGAIFREGDMPLRFSARSGTYYSNTEQIVMNEDVTISSDDGLTLKAGMVVWNNKDLILQIPDRLSASANGVNIVANSMDAFPYEDIYTVKGDVVAEKDGEYRLEAEELKFHSNNGSFEATGDNIILTFYMKD